MSIRSQIEANKWKSTLFILSFVAIVGFLSYVLGQALGYGDAFLPIAIVISLGSSFVSYYWSDKIVLAMSGARLADRKKDFDLYTVTENLCIAAHLPMPKLYVIDDTAMNAFATGRDPQHAVVCATTGIVSELSRAELEGVIAHELSHITNYDIRFMAIVSVLVGTIAYMADFFLRSLWWIGDRDGDRKNTSGIFLILGIVLAIISPIIATIIQMAVSRKRELLADASGADLTRNPEGLARALEKISSDKEVLEAATNATAHLYICNPFKGKEFGAWFSKLFDTHPPIEERVKLLRQM